MKHDISVVIPVYKEENRIKRCIKESLFFFRNNEKIKNFEIIFVADKSGDASIGIIQQYLLQNKEIRLIVNENREQKGGSVKIGVMNAKYEPLIYYDADLSTPLYEIDECLDLIDKYDIIIGSRGLKESYVQKKNFDIFLSNCFSLFKRAVLDVHFKDTQCGFKMFSARSKEIFEKQHIKSSCFDVEFLYIAQKYGYTIKEKPITWIYSDMSNFNTLHIILSFIKEVIEIKINAMTGLYDKTS